MMPREILIELKKSTVVRIYSSRSRAFLVATFLFCSIRLLLSSKTLPNVTSNSEIRTDTFIEGGTPPRRQFFWEQESSSCIYLDNICHENDRWFYRFSARARHQPTITYWQENITKSHGFVKADERVYFNVSASTIGQRNNFSSCSASSTPYHVVIQSSFNDMIGEFYSRSMLGINRWMNDYPTRFKEDVQLHVHFVEEKKRLFEGHQLFMNGLPALPNVTNFFSLVQESSCKCYEKLIFCGYELQNETVGVIYPERNGTIDLDKNTTIFKPSGLIKNPKNDCILRTDGNTLKKGKCGVYRKLRNDLLRTYHEKDSSLSHKVESRKMKILMDKGLKNKGVNVNEWKFVGLAIRKSRRKWLNVKQSMTLCRKKYWKHKIVCLLVDVESAGSPEEQLLQHHSLDALVGIHGAQLTQGVLLPNDGHVLELLPWVPDYLIGKWTQRKHSPTPLGIIFHNTELNHIGYGLDRESVPLCLHVDRSDKELEQRCLMNKTNGVVQKFRWADRDFNVPTKVIDDFISLFLLKDHNNSPCRIFNKNAMDKDFVLYNVHCKGKKIQDAYHFYHDRPENG